VHWICNERLSHKARMVINNIFLGFNTAIKSSSYNPLNKWQYLGCFNEKIDLEASGGERALYAGILGSLPTMTVRICITFCDWNTYEYAGLEYAQCVLIHSFFPGN
jgi:hypothetical protein